MVVHKGMLRESASSNICGGGSAHFSTIDKNHCSTPTQLSLAGSDSVPMSTSSALRFQETPEQEEESLIQLKSLQDTELFNSSTFCIDP